MAKVKSARRAAEVEAKRKASAAVGGGSAGAGGMEPPVGYLFGGLLLGFLGGGLSMRAWDALAVGRALVGTQWAADASVPMRVTMALPAWVWTLVLFASASAVMFAWMLQTRKNRLCLAVVAGGVSVLTMVVLGLGLYEPVVFGDTPTPSQEAIDAGVPVAE